MRTPISGAQFRDVKLVQKRGQDMAKLREIILLLIAESRCQSGTRITRSSAKGVTTAVATSSQTGC